jgi:hypothetical protein
MGILMHLNDRSARRLMRRLSPQLVPGWVALRISRDLRHDFERHLSTVADTVLREVQQKGALVLLADHAHQVLDEASLFGWTIPVTTGRWTLGEWYGLRLLACYRLATMLPDGPGLPEVAGRVPGPRSPG